MKVRCKHWEDCGVKGGGCCSINKYERPSFGVCLLACNENTEPATEKEKKRMLKVKSKGIGDTIKKVIDKVTRGKVKPCGKCKKRQEALNKLMPYGDNNNA